MSPHAAEGGEGATPPQSARWGGQGWRNRGGPVPPDRTNVDLWRRPGEPDVLRKWALFEKQLVKTGDFSGFGGGYLGPPENLAPWMSENIRFFENVFLFC